MTKFFTIGQAARAAGVGVETVRFYERKGLIEQPPKPLRGARRYPQAMIDRIRALRQGQELGFSLAETDGLLALRTDPAADCSEVRARAEAHLAEVERRRARLGEIADRLRELIAACPGAGATRECAILDGFTPGDPPKYADATRCNEGTGTRVELRVQGMVCSGCTATVRALLRNISGVHDASVDRVAGLARIRVDDSAGRDHVSGSPGYAHCFPTSGSHNPTWVEPGVYGEAQRRAEVVHALEHGNIVIYYDEPGSAVMNRLRAWASLYDGQWSGIVVIPAANLGDSIVLTAWTKRLRLDAFDPATAAAFIDAYRGRGPENRVR